MKTSFKKYKKRLLIGRAEWCWLNTLKIPAIKVKVDTGAKTSSLHAFDIKPITYRRKDYVSFKVHPLQANNIVTVECKAPILDIRLVMSSNGHQEHRYVISTELGLGDHAWDIELTLSNRDPLRYRMLLGREAMGHHVLVAPDKSMAQGSIEKKYLKQLYAKHK